MQRWLPWLVLSMAVLAGFAGFWIGRSRAPALPPPPAAAAAVIGQPLPTLDLVDRNTQPYALESLRGRRVLLNFWATWCAPCLKEIPLLNEIAANNTDLEVVGIAIDTPEAVTAFLDEHAIDYAVVFPREHLADPSGRLGNYLGALPYSVLVDAEGTLVRTKIGELKPDQVEAFLAP